VRRPSLLAILGGCNAGTAFWLACTLAGGLIAEVFDLSLYVMLPILIVCVWAAEQMFPRA
jgi:hypothetical protein